MIYFNVCIYIILNLRSTYRFFNSDCHTNLQRLDFHKHDGASFNIFTTVLGSELNIARNNHVSVRSSTSSSAFENFKNLLTEITSDIQCGDLDLSNITTPFKQRRIASASFKGSTNPQVIVKNQLYVITAAPRSHTELATYVEGRRDIQTYLTAEGESRILSYLLNRVSDDLFGNCLWKEFVKKKISINWIDTSTVNKELSKCSKMQMQKVRCIYLLVYIKSILSTSKKDRHQY